MMPYDSRPSLSYTAPRWSFPIALLLTLVIGVVDYQSGYEHRLAMLYLAPLALATWSLGPWAGMVSALVAVLCWLASFYKRNFYTDQIYFIWEAIELLLIFAIFVHLLWQLRRALLRADERFARVLEGLDAGIYVVIPTTGQIAYSNSRIRDMLGDAEDHGIVIRLENRLELRNRLAASETERFVSQEISVDDDRVYLAQSGSIPWESGQMGRLTVVRDITEQKKAEQARRKQQEILSSNARAAVLAEISTTLGHELNQPLMAVTTYLQTGILMLAKGNDATTDVLQVLQKCQGETARAARILQGTRQFLRQRVPARNGNDINRVIQWAVDAVGVGLNDVAGNIALHLGACQTQLMFDETLVEQVVINLITNALQAVESQGKDGRVAVRSKVVDGEILVSVMDNGAGVPPCDDEQVYRPFFTTKPNGLGLGLSICRSVIEAHGGRIWHQSVPQGGSEFLFTLPVS